VTGQYFANRHPKKSSGPSYDQVTAARLWQVSADLVGLTRAADDAGRPLHSPRI
jgi:hypothetical protein